VTQNTHVVGLISWKSDDTRYEMSVCSVPLGYTAHLWPPCVRVHMFYRFVWKTNQTITVLYSQNTTQNSGQTNIPRACYKLTILELKRQKPALGSESVIYILEATIYFLVQNGRFRFWCVHWYLRVLQTSCETVMKRGGYNLLDHICQKIEYPWRLPNFLQPILLARI
jgi:hypothetical protein